MFYSNSQSDRFLKISEVEKITCLSRSTILRRLENHEFPSFYRIGKLALWSYQEVQNWIAYIKEMDDISSQKTAPKTAPEEDIWRL